jgi:hypothetical protein
MNQQDQYPPEDLLICKFHKELTGIHEKTPFAPVCFHAQLRKIPHLQRKALDPLWGAEGLGR